MSNNNTPIVLNYPNFEQSIQVNLILVDFWAEWCEPCKVQEPILKEVINDLEGKLFVGKVNVDDNKVITSKYGVANIPTMLLFQKGEPVHRFTGIQSKKQILQTINKFI
jgi:thioredoxin 1